MEQFLYVLSSEITRYGDICVYRQRDPYLATAIGEHVGESRAARPPVQPVPHDVHRHQQHERVGWHVTTRKEITNKKRQPVSK